MTDFLALVLAFPAGALLGVFFFGGLWWTVQRGLASQTPALWFLGSLVVRAGVTSAGIFLVSQGHWSRLGACLLGFLIGRIVIVRRLARGPAECQTRSEREACIAP